MATDWTSIDSVQKLAQEQEQQLGPHDTQLATTLSTLADLHFIAEDFAAAEPLYWRVLSIRQKALGETHPETASSLQNLAELYEIQDRYAEAQRFYQWANAVRKNALLKAHSDKLDRTEPMERPPILPEIAELKKKCGVCGRQLLDAAACMYCTQEHSFADATLTALAESCATAQASASQKVISPVNALLRQGSSEKYMLDQTEMTIGRHPNNAIVLNTDKAVSRQHAKIVYDSGHFYICDCNTVNGTYVNAAKITRPTKLAQGDVVLIGRVALKAAFVQAQH